MHDYAWINHNRVSSVITINDGWIAEKRLQAAFPGRDANSVYPSLSTLLPGPCLHASLGSLTWWPGLLVFESGAGGWFKSRTCLPHGIEWDNSSVASILNIGPGDHMLCPALRLSLNVMIFKTTDYAGLWNCLHTLKKKWCCWCGVAR